LTDFLKDPLDFRVYLPPCYDLQIDRHYPVLYLFHGQGFSDDQWDRIGVDEEADALVAAGEISPLIIVMPHEPGSEPPTESKFAQAIIEDLIPYIDKRYRTLPNRADRAVGGLSRGGGWAVHFGISKWEMFGALGAHSPGVFRADDLYIRKWLDAIPWNSYPRIYIDIGDRDLPEIIESATWFEQILNEKDIPHEWHFFTGYHNEQYWRAHLGSYLRWYTQNW
jgi:enterochelin esterase-like enzyme